jgi:hypothetical protein
MRFKVKHPKTIREFLPEQQVKPSTKKVLHMNGERDILRMSGGTVYQQY